MSVEHRRGLLQYDIKTLLILTAFVAVALQLCVLIWSVMPRRLSYFTYGVHLLWTASWLASATAATIFFLRKIPTLHQNATQVKKLCDGSLAEYDSRDLRRQFRTALCWGMVNQLLWLGFTLGTNDRNVQWWHLGIIYLQVLPAAWASHRLQFRRYLESPEQLLRIMYFANIAGFFIPLLTLLPLVTLFFRR